jgi:negative regulator of flagellin synthesis FlgM
MIDNIKNLGTAAQYKKTDGSKGDLANANSQSATSDSAKTSVSSGQGGVQLSPEALKLEGIKQAVLSAPDIDTAKVDRIKAQISSGEYKVGFENLAKRMVDSFSQ